jgi:hypothetical protein
MTKQSILDQILSGMNEVNGKGLNDELAGSELTSITDKVAEIAGTVNPTHDYPPVLK